MVESQKNIVVKFIQLKFNKIQASKISLVDRCSITKLQLTQLQHGHDQIQVFSENKRNKIESDDGRVENNTEAHS